MYEWISSESELWVHFSISRHLPSDGHEAWRPSLRWWWCAASGSSCLVWSSFSSFWAWRDSCTNRTPTSRGGPGDEKKILPSCPIYLIALNGLNAVGKCCLEMPHTTSCVTRAVLDRFCSEAGRSSPLQTSLPPFMVIRYWIF